MDITRQAHGESTDVMEGEALPLHVTVSYSAMNNSRGLANSARLHDLDQFKFKVVERNRCHFFEDVQFKAPHVSDEDERVIIDFFEGRSLQELRPDTLYAWLGNLTIYPQLEQLVGELQEFLCDSEQFA